MALHDSPLAGSETRTAVLLTLSGLPHVPSYAADVIDRAGKPCTLPGKLTSSLRMLLSICQLRCYVSDFSAAVYMLE